MTGYHEVQMFEIPLGDEPMRLPPNWKPFAVTSAYGRPVIVARRWVREETKETEEPSA